MSCWSVSVMIISIHAPRGGSDEAALMHITQVRGFQSTLPVGGATGRLTKCSQSASDFNPRSPWGERLEALTAEIIDLEISIHAPRGGSD